jgi:hypothetical protein
VSVQTKCSKVLNTSTSMSSISMHAPSCPRRARPWKPATSPRGWTCAPRRTHRQRGTWCPSPTPSHFAAARRSVGAGRRMERWVRRPLPVPPRHPSDRAGRRVCTAQICSRLSNVARRELSSSLRLMRKTSLE